MTPADLILPYDCHLRYLTVNGILGDETWNLLSKRCPRLQVISYTNSEQLNPSLLEEFLHIPRLRGLILKVPNALTSDELTPFLEKFIENSKNHLVPVGTTVNIYLIQGNDRETVQETVEDALKCLNSTVVDGDEGDVEVKLHFCQYEGSFEFEFSEDLNGIDTEIQEAENETNSMEFHIRNSKYFNAEKHPRKLQVIGKRDEEEEMGDVALQQNCM